LRRLPRPVIDLDLARRRAGGHVEVAEPNTKIGSAFDNGPLRLKIGPVVMIAPVSGFVIGQRSSSRCNV
jgi:hypothetical protein